MAVNARFGIFFERSVKIILVVLMAICFVPSSVAFADEPSGSAIEPRAEGLDNRSEALAIQVNQTVSNYIKSSTDKDYYKFTLPAAGKVNLTFSSDFVDGTRGWKYRLIDEAGEEFTWWTHMESHVGDQTTMDFGLPAGTYYVVVSARDDFNAAWSDATYSFRVNYEQRDDWETERNNDRGVADDIASGKQYYGSLYKETGVDYYAFSLNSPASVTLDFGIDFVDERTGWCIELRDVENNVVESWTVFHDSVYGLNTDAIYLPAGKYYVTVGARDNFKAAWSPDTYRLRMNVLTNYGFSDVVAGDWYANDEVLGYALGHNLMSGYGNGLFGPYDAVTRGQIATILWRIAGEPNANSQDFSDVDYGEFYGRAIEWARSTGVISGYGDTNTFGPNDYVTREQLCVMLANYAQNVAHISASSDCSRLDSIAGSWSVSSWAREQMGWAVDWGIISGETTASGVQVNPQGYAQRCAVAKMASVFHRDVLNLG